MPQKITRRQFLRLVSASSATLSFTTHGADMAMGTNQVVRAKYDGLVPLLSAIREESLLPAIAAAVMQGGVLAASGAMGVRKLGDPAAVTVLDKFHIGSCTKAMTSTVAALLVEQAQIQWTSTLGRLFPERVSPMHTSFKNVTLEMLLTHRSGAPRNIDDDIPANASVCAQRLAYMDAVINKAPDTEPGMAFRYSNAGYVIAGAMLERATGRSWEELVQSRLFKPLGMASAGFGPPSKPHQTNQPWGHVFKDGKFEPRYGDNPAFVGPAGTVHCTLFDYLRFADLHLCRGARHPGFLSAASFAKLQEPQPKQNYAFGWIVTQRHWAQGRALTHTGSNTMNCFSVWLAPQIDLSLVIATNAAGDNVPRTIETVAIALIKEFTS